MYYFVYVGQQFPFSLDYQTWVYALLAYAFFASVTPVGMLLQPRDYLNSFLLYGLIISAVVGVLVANPTIHMDTEVHFSSENLGYLFPCPICDHCMWGDQRFSLPGRIRNQPPKQIDEGKEMQR